MVAKTFTGGDKLQDRLNKLAKKLGQSASVEVGWAEGATYPATGGGDPVSVASVADIQEFGAPRASIPPRPFFRPMIAKESSTWGAKLNAALGLNNCDAHKALKLVGDDIAGALVQSIADVNSPALSPVTLMLRKMRQLDPDLVVTGKTVGEAAAKVAAGQSTSGVSTKPLVDSGTMMDNISVMVK